MPKTSNKGKSTTRNESKVGSVLRTVLVVILVGLTSLSVVVWTAVRWTESRVLSTDNWVAYITPLPKNPEVSQALSGFIVSKVFDATNAQKKIQEVLPPRAAFLVPPLTEQIEGITIRTTKNIIISDAFQNIWVTANRLAHQRMLERARGDSGDSTNQWFNLDLSRVGPVLREKMGDAAAALPQKGSGDIVISADLQAKRDTLRRYILGVDFLQAVLPFLVVACVFGALAVARDRRRVMLAVSVLVFVVSLLQLIGIKSLRPTIIGKVQNFTYRPAVGELYDSFVASFNSAVYIVLLVAFIIWLVMMLAGPGTIGVTIRQYLRLDQAKKNRYYEYWKKLRLWISQQKVFIWAGIALVALMYGAFGMEFSWQELLNVGLIALTAIAFVQILASPSYLTAEQQ